MAPAEVLRRTAPPLRRRALNSLAGPDLIAFGNRGNGDRLGAAVNDGNGDRLALWSGNAIDDQAIRIVDWNSAEADSRWI